jgi:GNAT superfamily N-acetyltransferase
MCDLWMPTIRLPLTLEEFRQLPRNAAYKYEFLAGQVFLSPRPRHYHAVLDLRRQALTGAVDIRLLGVDELMDLVPLFLAAFRHIQPYGSIADEATRLEAAREALQRTRTGGDGPWIQQASFAAYQEAKVVGAILITLLPDADPCDRNSYHWPEPPPSDCIARRLGRPHLTWIFVSPLRAGQGIGTALLAAAGNALWDLGYQQLLSTFLLGNESSMLWHWRNGFQLLAFPGSMRRCQ